jgi:hypothetical protein
MYDLKVRRLTAVFGLAIVALNWAMFPLYLIPGPAPQYQDTARFIDYWTTINGFVLTRVLLDILECACLLVFAAGLRHLIRQARSEYEWVGTLTFGAGLAPPHGHPSGRLAGGWPGPGHGRWPCRPLGDQNSGRGLHPHLSVDRVHLDCALLGRGGVRDPGHRGAAQVDRLDGLRRCRPQPRGRSFGVVRRSGCRLDRCRYS